MIQFNFAMWLNELVELPQVDSDKSCQSVCPTATVVWLIELIDNWRNLALKDQEGIENYLENVSGREFIEGLQKSISDDFIFLQKLLITYSPCNTSRWEIAPFVFRRKFRRTISSERNRCKIFTVVVIIHSA